MKPGLAATLFVGTDIWSTLIFMALLGTVFYFLMYRPGQKRQQQQQDLQSSMGEGTRVMLTSGIVGTIKQRGEKQVVVEVAPGVPLTVMKAAIARPVKPEEEEFEYELEDDEPAPALEQPTTGADAFFAPPEPSASPLDLPPAANDDPAVPGDPKEQ